MTNSRLTFQTGDLRVAEPPSLSELIELVETDSFVLSIYNSTLPSGPRRAIREFFDSTSISVRELPDVPDVPTDLCLLHDGDSVVTATDLNTLAAFITTTPVDHRTDSLPKYVPELLLSIEEPVRTEWGTRRMILASRIIEQRAYHYGRGRLDVGFQLLSRFMTQREIYRQLGTMEIDVHVYGEPDADLPAIDGITVHPSDAREIRDHWFVVHSTEPSPSVTDRQGITFRSHALLARERDPGVYTGCWSKQPAVASQITERLQQAYPANG